MNKRQVTMFIKPLVLSWTHTDNYMKEHDYRSLVAPTVKTMQYSDHPDSRLNLPQPVNLADLQKQREEKKKESWRQMFRQKKFLFCFFVVVVVVVVWGKVKKNAFTKRHHFF